VQEEEPVEEVVVPQHLDLKQGDQVEELHHKETHVE
jgi:hypothetical protein